MLQDLGLRLFICALLPLALAACQTSESGGEPSASAESGTATGEAPAAEIFGDIGPWKLAEFVRPGNVRADGDTIVIERGRQMSGIIYTGEDIPRMNYEIRCEAMRVDGNDFFFGLTFPYGEANCSFVAGGWGGSVTGLSSVNYYDASENQTHGTRVFENGTWYKMRLQVTPLEINVWIDDEQVVNLQTDGQHIGLRWEMEDCLPLGIANFDTTSAIRGFMIRELPESEF